MKILLISHSPYEHYKLTNCKGLLQMKLFNLFIIFSLSIVLAVSGCELFESGDLIDHRETVQAEELRKVPHFVDDEGRQDITYCEFISFPEVIKESDIHKSLRISELLVIDSEEKFDKYIACNEEKVTVDLQDHFILAGGAGYGNKIAITDWDTYLTPDTLLYHVELLHLGPTIPGAAEYMIKIPNEYRYYPVKFEVSLVERSTIRD